MAEWFVLRWPRGEDPDFSWMAVDGAGHQLRMPQRGTLEQALADRGARPLCVLVPAADVLLTEAPLPAKGGAKLAQVVPFALEEQLAEDIDSLHFAVGKRNAQSGLTGVAAVERSLIEGWLATLRAAGADPDAIYSEASLVAGNPGQVVAWLDGDSMIVAPPGAVPTLTPATSLEAAFGFLAARHAYGPGIEPQSLALLLCAPPVDWQAHAGELGFLQEHFEHAKVQLLPQGSLPWLASQVALASPVNLLQGAYASRHAQSHDWRRWRVPAALAAGIVALAIVGQVLGTQRLRAEERELDAGIEATFRSAMPGVQDSSDARQRMQARLNSLGSGEGQAGLLPVLAAVAAARQEVPTVTLQGLAMRDGGLDLRVSAPNAEGLEQVNQALRSRGYNSEVTSGSAGAEGYEGRIAVRLGAAR